MIKCKNCFPQKGCWAQERAKIYGVEEYGEVKGEQNMMNEILQRGPITCAIAVTNELSTILEVSSKTKPVGSNSITISVLLVGVKKTEPNIGSLETLGEAIGAKEETLD